MTETKQEPNPLEEKFYAKISPSAIALTHAEEGITIPRDKMMALYEALLAVTKLKDGEEKTFELVSKATSSSQSLTPGSPEWFKSLQTK